MGKLRRFTVLFLTLLMLSTSVLTANATLQAVGPTDPATTLPTWYQDPTDLALQPCLDQNGFCILTPPFDPAVTNPPDPITTTGPIDDINFPDESFYFIADAQITGIGGPLVNERANLRMAIEAAFLSGVVPNQGITFLRVNLQQMLGLTPNSTYTVTYPYGTFQFSTDGAGKASAQGGAAYRAEDPIAPVPGVYFPPEMQSGTLTHIGPFLKTATGLIVDPVSGHTYIGDAATPVPVIGSPTGNNLFRITGPNIGGPGVNSVETNLFTLAGRVFTGPIARPLTIDRSTYARNADGGQVDIFVTSLANATITITGNGIPTTVMTPDPADGTKYFSHIPFTGTTLPSSLVITNSLDLVSPIPHPVTLVDEVAIPLATFNPVSKALSVRAVSRDKVAPLPTFTATSLATPNTFDATGLLVKTLAAIPPATVTVTSSRGGSATLPVSVVIPPAPPVAADDATQTVANTPVQINVLINDTTADTLDLASIVTANATNGTAVANPNGTVTFTPATDFAGPASFTYTVKDSLAQVSNTATVTVTVFGTSPATGLTLFSNVPSPQLAGTLVSFDASASGGSGNYEYRYWLRDQNGVYSLVRDYSPSTVWTWNTTGLPSNSDYAVAVQARSVGSVTAAGFDQERVMNFRLNAPSSPGVAVNVTPNLVTPQVQGSQVYFTAAVTGGTGTYEYQFWLKPASGTAADYVNVQPYGLNSTWKWDTTAVTPGEYTLAVQARVLGSPNIFDAEKIVGYVINPLPTAATGLNISTNLPSGQPAGTQVFVTGTASGGTVPYEYQFWLKDTAGVYSLMQPFTTSAIWHWDTTGLTAGTYTVAVQARSQGSTTTGFNVENTIPFDIQ